MLKRLVKVLFYLNLINLILAMLKRSRKVDSSMQQYYIVIGAFVAICVASVLYVLLNPKKSFSAMQVIDESQILVHNGQPNAGF